MAKNADKLYYPIKESIMSILPIVDEFIVAIGKGDEDDRTRDIVASIKDDKVKIIDTEWDIEKYPRGMEHAHQTDIAKEHCSGDWLFYLQADEVIHEKYLPAIQMRCEELLDDTAVEGLLFKYKHFWGDYDHFVNSHGWYKHEIRIIRNRPEIHSWKSAQSFRRMPDFDGLNYRVKEGTYKLNVAHVDAYVFHYGWVRPPKFMKKKTYNFNINHRGAAASSDIQHQLKSFDYGPLQRLSTYRDSHPSVMKKKIRAFDWGDELNYTRIRSTQAKRNKHEKYKYRMLTIVENYLLGGKPLFQAKNYVLLKRK